MLVVFAGVAACGARTGDVSGKDHAGANSKRGVPNEVELPGTQPGQLTIATGTAIKRSVDPSFQCFACHGNYDRTVEPGHLWSGSMMANAGRDPIFWATLAVAQRDFPGAGDFCIRCHSPSGWLAGRSTPTDGSALNPVVDGDGIECDFCHRLTDPAAAQLRGVQTPPFVAVGGSNTAHRGAAQYVLHMGPDKLGPYPDPDTKHPAVQSLFHRSPELCATCHDVSNPVTGDLAPGNGAQVPLAAGAYSGVFGSPLNTKAAFKSLPAQYGVVERTYSEHLSSAWPTFRVADFPKLPPDLQDGAFAAAYKAAQAAGKGGDYEDGSPRFYICETCHMAPRMGAGVSSLHNNAVVRNDLARHDLTGGNYWVPEAIAYLDKQNRLRLGGGLNPNQLAALEDGAKRARFNLGIAASLKVAGNSVRVTNLTGHKLISGYPEGRRMWLEAKWYDGADKLVKEDGAYGQVAVTINGKQQMVETLLAPETSPRVYEIQGAVTSEWASKLVKIGTSPELPLSFDRISGKVTHTLGELARAPKGTMFKTFHFILNNTAASDNRIPPYGFRYADAAARNALPVPASQFGAPSKSETYRYYDDVSLKPPAGAVRAEIRLLYQPTSWEYLQFLNLANPRTGRLAGAGDDLLEAWLATGMAKPQVMATAAWSAPK